MTPPVDWRSPRWGKPGHNIHTSPTGAWGDTDESEGE